MEVYGEIPQKNTLFSGYNFLSSKSVNLMLHSKGDAKKLYITVLDFLESLI